MQVICCRWRMRSRLGEFTVQVQDRWRQIRSCVTRRAVLLVGSTQETYWTGSIMRHVATAAAVLSDRAVTTDVRRIGCGVARSGMNARGPSCQEVRLPIDHPSGVMTRQAQLRVGAVTHQEQGKGLVDVLKVWLMTGRAFDGA